VNTGAGRHVFFYDPGSGQVGWLGAATSRFTKAQPAAAWVAPGGGGHIAARQHHVDRHRPRHGRPPMATLAEVGTVPIDARLWRNRYVGRRRADRVLAASPIGTNVVRPDRPAAPTVRDARRRRAHRSVWRAAAA
jgi:hypothetical protein